MSYTIIHIINYTVTLGVHGEIKLQWRQKERAGIKKVDIVKWCKNTNTTCWALQERVAIEYFFIRRASWATGGKVSHIVIGACHC